MCTETDDLHSIIFYMSPILSAAQGCPAPTQTPGVAYNCTGKPDGNYLDAKRCTYFVSCVGGQYAYERPCPFSTNGMRLHYDPDNDSCDYPGRAGCRCLNLPCSDEE
ncbi:hypothetical protein BU23DRAFT_659097 [Bimuria novae-zelandiae CBS 107.79]|uniref:Chitin-binding type-2 domain-containing protein n=1 Tax=Bimuria novae-zelandiae CBS 107.79 TaxID=1447943 RepID=A0A6A5UQL0_9PLEO|nr:hypothetical protein BU23DRAFT_659097 [Bimuria novae-zelandiae CBS 107.79]